MADSPPTLSWRRREGGHRAAIVFIHGFGGSAEKTWGRFPEFVCDNSALAAWDVASMGYSTGLAPGLLEGLWSGSPSIGTLAGLLIELARSGDLADHKGLTFVAHSMGGLVTQRALLDSEDLAQRTSHVFLYGTPSKGLKKASWVQRWKRQIRDMVDDGEFIETLRREWTEADLRFEFRAVAGDEDQFVPPWSSLEPFPEEQRAVVLGNHLTMVKPMTQDALCLQVLVTGLQGQAAPEGPWNAARLALELLDFQRVIGQFWPNRDDLTDRDLVTLALALDAVGRAEESRDVLEQAGKIGTDAQGTLAGRLKRQWLQSGGRSDGNRALEIYQDAYGASKAKSDWDQAYYHGINVAFMNALFLDDSTAAAEIAKEVLGYCEQAKQNHWSLATEGEARFYLGEWGAGFDAYAAAIAAHAGPREIESMYQQAVAILARLAPREERESLQERLEGVFGW